jgi:Kef-type K+ transport system membrane component KefB
MGASSGEVGSLLLALALVVVVARVGGSLARAVGQPPVIGEMAAGIALGPSLLGAVAPGAFAWLFPATVHDDLRVAANLGVVLFVFMIGAELDGEILRSRSRSVLTVTAASMAVPFALGAAAALALRPELAADGAAATPFVLFVGVALSVTAFPVLARIVEGLAPHARRLGTTALTCAALTDGLAWCLLVVVAAQARASGARSSAERLALVVLFVAAALLVAAPLLRRLGQRARRVRGAEAALAIAVALLFAQTSDSLGVHVVVGAFVAGLAVRGFARTRDRTLVRVDRLNRSLLLPAFFASVGLTTNVRAVASPALLAAGALVLLLAVAGKFGVTTVVARATGLDWRDSVGLGALLNTKGLTELVVLKTGLELGLLSSGGFTALVLVTLVTTASAGPVLRRLGLASSWHAPLALPELRALRAHSKLAGELATPKERL